MGAKHEPLQLTAAGFKGLVLNPSIINRDFNSAQLCSNFVKRKDGKGTIRKGTTCQSIYRDSSTNNRELFPFTYTYNDITTGATKEIFLGLGYDESSFTADNIKLFSITEATLVITYTGTGTGTIDIAAKANPSLLAAAWTVTVKANGVSVLSRTTNDFSAATQSYGTFDDLVTAIDGLTDFSCSPSSITGFENVNFIDFWPKAISIAHNGTYSITYYKLTQIAEGEVTAKSFTDANFVLPSALNYSNVIYFAFGGNEYKYDGQDFYRSGLPQATINAIADAAGGTTFPLGGVYIYKLVYKRVDNKTNIVEGEDSDDTLTVATHTMVANKNISLTINNLTSSSLAYHALKRAQVNGLQTTVSTITVDSGHTIVVGDIVYFYDGVSAAYVTRNVTAKGATTITVDGATVTVADNIVISNNVRVEIWRTKNGSTDFYFVDEIPNDSANATTVYTDSKADTLLIEPYTEQTRKFSEPPKCSFVTSHQGLKVTGGDPDNPNTLSWTIPNNPEAYPLRSNNSLIRGGGLGSLTGGATLDDNTFVAFKEFGHTLLAGTFDDLLIEQKDKVNTGIGCTSFRTLAHVGDADQLIGLSRRGIFISVNSELSLVINKNIRPLFPNKQTPQVNGTQIPTTQYISVIGAGSQTVERVLKRAVALNDNLDGKYHICIPAEVGTPANFRYLFMPTTKYLVYDYEAEVPYWAENTYYNRYRHSLSLSSSIIPGCMPNTGFALYKNKLWSGGCYKSSIGQIYSYIFSQNDGDTAEDYREASYPVYLDIHYTPFEYVVNQASVLFKPLYVNLHKFLSDVLVDGFAQEGLGSDFDFRIKCIRNFRNYATNPVPTTFTVNYITNALKTFKVAAGATCASVKTVTDKCRAFQIQLTNEDLTNGEYEQILFDMIELIYCDPYRPAFKEPRGDGV